MLELTSGRPAATVTLRPQRTPPPNKPRCRLFDRLRCKWSEFTHLLRSSRPIDADDLLSSLRAYQRLKMLDAIDANTEQVLLGMFDACLDG